MNINNAADKMRVALNEARYYVDEVAQTHGHTDQDDAKRVRTLIELALAEHQLATKRQLIIAVCGEGASLALTDCLTGWEMRPRCGNSTWRHIYLRDDPHHVRALIKDLGIRATVREE